MFSTICMLKMYYAKFYSINVFICINMYMFAANKIKALSD